MAVHHGAEREAHETQGEDGARVAADRQVAQHRQSVVVDLVRIGRPPLRHPELTREDDAWGAVVVGHDQGKEDERDVCRECDADEDPLPLLGHQQDEGHDEPEDGVDAQDVELHDEDVVQHSVEEEQAGTDQIGARPPETTPRRRLPLDLETDPEHDGEQPEELALRRPREQLGPPDVDDTLAEEGLEQPDVAGQRAQDGESTDDVERGDARSLREVDRLRERWRDGCAHAPESIVRRVARTSVILDRQATRPRTRTRARASGRAEDLDL